MRQKQMIALGMLLIMLTLGGCGYKDIDKRFFVVGIGIDKAKNNEKLYAVSFKLAIPSSEIKAGKEKFILITEQSDSITEAARIVKSKVDKELDFGHAKILLFGEPIAEKEIQKTIDWFIRRRDIQRIAWVGIGKPSAAAVLSQKPSYERLPSNALFLSFGKSGTESAYITSTYLFDFRRRLQERGLDPILPIIEVNENELFTINKAAIFNKQSLKLVLPPEETKLLNALLNKVDKIDLKISEGSTHLMIAGDHVKTEYTLNEAAGKKPSAIFTVTISGAIEETRNTLADQNLSPYEKIAEKEMAHKLVALLKKLQKANVDPIGLGLRYRATHFNNETEWAQWEKIYPTIDFTAVVDFDLRGTGIIK